MRPLNLLAQSRRTRQLEVAGVEADELRQCRDKLLPALLADRLSQTPLTLSD